MSAIRTGATAPNELPRRPADAAVAAEARKLANRSFIRKLWARYRDDDVTALAAQLAYSFMLALFPFLLFVANVAGFFYHEKDGAIREIVRYLPTESADTVVTIVNETSAGRSGFLLVFGMLAALWAASGGVNAFIKGMNKAYDVRETRVWWKVRGLSLLATLFLAATIFIVFALLVFGDQIGEYAFKHYPALEPFETLWTVVRFVLPVAAVFGAIALLFNRMPNRLLGWREVWPGAAFTTVSWIGASALFSVYVDHFGNYSNTYGSLGAAIILLTWLYYSAIVLLLGGEINATIHADRHSVD
ncbi:YihY/virulence factor BrkB family protein [Cohnella sp. GCM10027633]|uniref:YihY/virulence factor BrkB family protein n=1 Tax=unclassified Cohnella TaxID=2636738 RepID=UPI00362A0199